MAITTNADPEKWDFINLVYGDRWPPYSFEVVDEEDAPILGFGVTMQIRPVHGATTVKELTNGSGFTIASNIVTFDADVDFVPGLYVHDIEILLSGELIPITQYKGAVLVNWDITRPGSISGIAAGMSTASA